MRLFANADYKFIERRKTAYAFSSLLIMAGVVAMIVNVFTIGSWLNYGVDFTGGTLVQVSFNSEVDVADVRDALGGADAPPITRFGEENEYVVRAPLVEDGSGDASMAGIAAGIESSLSSAFGAGSFEIVRTELVGAKVGSELQQKAGLAILFSFVATLAYLALRFEPRFGAAAVIATAHDLGITLGLLAIFRMEVAVDTVAALLTVVGYSLNDTIVVFDRIREDMHKKGARKRDRIELINRAINETLPRTVLTGGTTFATLVAMLVFGGPVIRGFCMVLLLGILFGTYSSIFVASPALIEIQKRWGEGTLRGDKKKERPAPATV